MAAAGSHHAGPRACERVPPEETAGPEPFLAIRGSGAILWTCGSDSASPGDGRSSSSPSSRHSARSGRRPAPRDAVKLTYIGDSKAAAIEFSPTAKRLLARGHTVRRDLKVCRRLVAPSCPYQGVTPTTALRAIRNYGTGLGTGARDRRRLQRHVRDVSRAAQPGHARRAQPRGQGRRLGEPPGLGAAAGPPRLRDASTRSSAESRQRWPQLYVANWNAYTRGKPASWFGHDGHPPDERRRRRPRSARAQVDPPRGGGPASAHGAARLRLPHGGPGPRRGRLRPVADLGRGQRRRSADRAQPCRSGANLAGATDGVTGLRSVLTFAGGAAIMLFLIVVTTQAARRRLS